MVAQDFGYIVKLNNKTVFAAQFPPIVETQMLYNQLLKLGYKVIFLTGRRDYQTAATQLNLQRANFATYRRLVPRPSYSPQLRQASPARARAIQPDGSSIQDGSAWTIGVERLQHC